MKKTLMTCATAAILAASSWGVQAEGLSGKKVLFIDSYHAGYKWSDGITKGIQDVVGASGAELKIHRMDTKRNTSEEFKTNAAAQAKALIEEFKPDVVIAADDNASKYLIMPFYKDGDVPFVFAGVNWDASVYGYPYANVTGMVEVSPAPELVEQLRVYAKGDKVGFLGLDVLTSKKEVENYKKVFGLESENYFAKDYEDWKKAFISMQDKVDMMIIDADHGLFNDYKEDMAKFVQANTKIPTGTVYDFMAEYAVIGFTKLSVEQGEWAANAAVEILGGAKPADIEIARNEKGRLIVNAKLASSAGIEVSFDMVEAADQVIE